MISKSRPISGEIARSTMLRLLISLLLDIVIVHRISGHMQHLWWHLLLMVMIHYSRILTLTWSTSPRSISIGDRDGR